MVMMNRTNRQYARIVDFIYVNTKPGHSYEINQVIRGQVSRYGSRKATMMATLAAARKASPHGDISPGYFEWHRFHRVYRVSIRVRGNRDDVLQCARAAYQLWTGKEAPR